MLSTEPNSVNGVPFEDIISVKWVLEDDIMRYYLESDTYYPNQFRKEVDYPKSPSEVMYWRALQKDEYYEVPKGADIFRSNPTVRGVCTGEIVPESTNKEPYSAQFPTSKMRDSSTQFNRARILLNEPMYPGELYAFGLRVRNPTFLDSYVHPMVTMADKVQKDLAEYRRNGWDEKVDENVLYKGG